jgi:hypothetical protein
MTSRNQVGPVLPYDDITYGRSWQLRTYKIKMAFSTLSLFVVVTYGCRKAELSLTRTCFELLEPTKVEVPRSRRLLLLSRFFKSSLQCLPMYPRQPQFLHDRLPIEISRNLSFVVDVADPVAPFPHSFYLLGTT